MQAASTREERRRADRLLDRLLRGMIVILNNCHLRFAAPKQSHGVLSARFEEGRRKAARAAGSVGTNGHRDKRN